MCTYVYVHIRVHECAHTGIHEYACLSICTCHCTCVQRALLRNTSEVSQSHGHTLLGLLPSSVRIRINLQGKLENRDMFVFRVTIQPHSEGENE